MSKVRILNFTISLDGYGAGPNQAVDNPLGVGGEELHNWMIKTATFQKLYGGEGGDEGIDNDFTVRGLTNIGAWILGRNMFTLSRGEWPDDGWKGWWGDNPPYHAPVFVLTHHPRASIPMEGGTTFYFVTEGIHAALERARQAAGDEESQHRDACQDVEAGVAVPDWRVWPDIREQQAVYLGEKQQSRR